MTTSSVKNCASMSLLACAALLTVGLAAPQKAHANAATATALGGAALFTSVAHASQPAGPPIAVPTYPQASIPPPVMVAQPMGLAIPHLSPLHQPTIYSSVTPTALPEPVIKTVLPISYQVSAPSAPPLAMPAFQTGPSPVIPQQALSPQPFQPLPSGTMPPASYQGQGLPPAQQSNMMLPQQGGMTMPQQAGAMPQQAGMAMPQQSGMMWPQQAGMMPQQAGMTFSQQAGMMPQQAGMTFPQQAGMMPQQANNAMPRQAGGPAVQQVSMPSQGGYSPSMPSTSFSYARQ